MSCAKGRKASPIWQTRAPSADRRCPNISRCWKTPIWSLPRRREATGFIPHAQLVAHHDEELRPHPLQFLKRGEVLHGDHHPTRPPSSAWTRRRVDERGDAAPVGGRNHDLQNKQRLGAAHDRLRQRELVEGDLVPVGESKTEDPSSRSSAVWPGMGRLSTIRLASANSAYSGWPVPTSNTHDADRRGLESAPRRRGRAARRGRSRALAIAVGLGGEQHQDLLVLVGARLAALLLDEIEVADMDSFDGASACPGRSSTAAGRSAGSRAPAHRPKRRRSGSAPRGRGSARRAAGPRTTPPGSGARSAVKPEVTKSWGEPAIGDGGRWLRSGR